jgi:glutathione S-transferase
MKLYMFELSSNARKVLIAAELLGVKLERAVVHLGKQEQKFPDYIALNPNGRVPTLVDGDFVLWESNAIMQYLADSTPGNSIYPTELKARADVNRWMFWQANHWGPPIGALNFENMIKKMVGAGEPDTAFVKRNEELLKQFGGVLDAHLKDREWVSGSTMTIADIAIGTSMMFLVPAKLPLDSFANVMRWFGRLRELPAWKATEPAPMSR